MPLRALLRPTLPALLGRLAAALLVPSASAQLAPAWPDGSYTSRPWVRWYWPGGAADEAGVSRQLEEIAIDGFGGVCLSLAPGDPAKAAQFRPWLGPGSVEMIAHAAREAERLGLGFDLDDVAGHPLGGPSVTGVDRATRIRPVIVNHEGGVLELDFGGLAPAMLLAWPRNGEAVDLLPWIEGGRLRWESPPGNWSVFGIIAEPTDQQVEDPAPGAEGWVLDPFDPAAMERFLARHEEAWFRYDGPFPRAHFLDLSGDEQADWSPAVPSAFGNNRGYPLAGHLPALFGEGPGGEIERVLADYRETLAELRLLAATRWRDSRLVAGSQTRAASHDSSGHPLDLPALFDIPTVMAEAPLGEADRRRLHFAASAAMSRATPLVAAELSWPDHERFRVTPGAIKRAADQAWLGGATHLVLHSIRLPGGGRLGPHPPHLDANDALRAGRDALAGYIGRCQALLQASAPDARVLLYLPMHDCWAEGDAPAAGALDRWLQRSGYRAAAATLEAAGIPYHTVSDRMIREIRVEDGQLILGELPHATLVFPEVTRLSENTALKLLEIGQLGGHLSVAGSWPRDVPGMVLADIRRGTLFQALQGLPEEASSEGDDLVALLAERGVEPEPMAALGIDFIRRRELGGYLYFLTNTHPVGFDGWLPLSGHPAGVSLLDPLLPALSGKLPLRRKGERSECRITLAPGQAVFLRTVVDEVPVALRDARSADPANATVLAGTWRLNLPAADDADQADDAAEIETPMLGPWTSAADARLRATTGPVSYRLDFPGPEELVDGDCLLELGTLASTATVRLNGKLLGEAFAAPFQLLVREGLLEATNTLEVEVTDRPTQADTLSGLLGPVRLVPLVAAGP